MVNSRADARQVNAAVDRARVYQVFNAALDVSTHELDAFMREQCSDDAAMRREVETLLAVGAQGARTAEYFLNDTALPARDLVGKEYGQFRLLELIGKGGMGVVYRAERTDGVPQTVAVKLIGGEMTPTAAARFLSEANLLARLEHPAIARLIDVGLKEGERWIALELVRGLPIEQFCDARGLGVRARVKLMIDVVGAVALAHRVLVVHRDIKPSNVLVTDDGHPKLIDFGIAAALRADNAPHEATADTRRLFTPNYAAPEQVMGEPATVATDVFGLGALAYRLLSGRAPHAESGGAVGYMLSVTHHDVRLPSQAAESAGLEPARVRGLKGDLDAILMKALARDPSLRYARAEDLQGDLQRHLDGLPVIARAPIFSYRAGRFAKRHAMGLAVATMLLLGLASGGVIYGLQAQRVAKAQSMAARRDAFLENLLKSANPRGGRRDISVAELLDSAAASLDAKLAGEPLVEASMLGTIVATDVGLGRYQAGLLANDRQLKILHEHGGSNLEIGQALVTRGELLREQGLWAQADAVLHDAVATLRPLHAASDLCSALYLVAVVLAHEDRQAESEQTYLEVAAIESRGDEQMRARRAQPYQGLAVMMADLGRYEESLEYARKALDIAQRALPPEHPDLLAYQTTYASSLNNLHQSAAAEVLLRQVIDTETRVLGADHKDTLLARLIQVDALIELHRNAEAAAGALGLARQLDALLGPDNLYTLQAWQEYGIAECNDHQETEGLEALRRVENARRRMLPVGQVSMHRTQVGMGVCLERTQRYAEAEPRLLAAVAALESERGPSHRGTQEAYRALLELFTAMGRKDEAARWAAKIIL